MSTKIRMTAVMAVFLAMPTFLNAQYSPAQGPPPASGTNISTLEVGLWVTNPIKAKIQQKLIEVNAALAAGTEARAKLTLQSFEENATILTQTQRVDEPNHRYVKVMHMAIIKVTDIQWNDGIINCPPGSFQATHGYCNPAQHGQIDWDTYPWDRTISVAVDVNIFCDGWESGAGIIKAYGDPGPPYLDPNPGVLEGALSFFLGGWLVDYVNGKLQAALGPLGASSIPTSWQCNSLDAGAQPGSTPKVFRFAKLPVPNVLNYITVQPIAVKRLDANNAYEAVEHPGLEFWADFGFYYYALPAMTEGQEVSLIGTPPITVPQPRSGNSLVIIASTNNSVKDSTFKTFGSPNFGNGTQKIRVSKTIWEPARPPLIPKPSKLTVAAYEITFRIVNPGTPENAPAPPTPPRSSGSAPLPGGIAP